VTLQNGPVYAFGDYELDTRRHELRHAGDVVRIEPQVFSVLAYLFASRDRVVPKDELLDGVCRYVAPTTLKCRSRAPTFASQAIKAARQAVGDDGSAQSVIRTVHGLGFRIVADVVERDAIGSADGIRTEAHPRTRALPRAAGPLLHGRRRRPHRPRDERRRR
jgi:DNA-binding winged helix-turn-helix (wHTH) protein